MTGTSRLLAGLVADAAGTVGGSPLGARLRAVAERLGAPLQVAVAGPVSSGKSTLVNAFLGREVARADAGECTRSVTCFEYGDDDGAVTVDLFDGGTRHVRLADGLLPTTYGVDPALVRRVVVRLTAPALRGLTVVDTPGVDTVSADNERAARRAVFGTDGADHAQALVYLLRSVQRYDADALAEFRDLSAACGMTGANTLAVLGQVDRRGDDPDPWPSARRLAARAYDALRAAVVDVVPVVGLLARTARAGLLGPADLAALRRLADVDLDDALLDLTGFAADPAHRRLVGMLHAYGVRVAVETVRDHPDVDLAGLHAVLLDRSGFGAGDAPGTVAGGLAHFARHADQLKALAALADLRRILRDAPDTDRLGPLRAAVDEDRPVLPGLRGLRIAAAVDAVGRGRLPLDGDLLDDLLRLARSDDPARQVGLPVGAAPADIARAAAAATVRWRRWASTVSGRPAGGRARDVLAVYEDLAAGTDHAEPVTVDRALLAVLDGSPTVPDAERRALADLAAATHLAGQVGADPGDGPAVVAARAAELAGRFRILLRRPLPRAERQAVQAVCDTYETIWTGARGAR